MTKEQIAILDKALKFMCDTQDELEHTLRVNQVSWLNMTYDEVMVSMGNDPDGDYQTELCVQGNFYSFDQCIEEIRVRLDNTFSIKLDLDKL